MARAEWLLAAALTGLAGCAATPPPPPVAPLRAQAQEAEATALRRHVQGDAAAAARHYAQAVRLYQSLDDSEAVQRTRLQLAQTLLTLGQPQAALEQATLGQTGALRVDALLLQAQAQLALQHSAAAAELLRQAQAACGAPCPAQGRLLLLQARSAWADADAARAAQQAEAALPMLQQPELIRERANAWRLLAAAALRLGRHEPALQAAQQALALDRQEGLPEKIAQDWLLLGEIQRLRDPAQARQAFERAAQVAQAADLAELARRAATRIQEIPP